MDEFQRNFVEALDRHDMVRVQSGETKEDGWTLTSKREDPETGEMVEVTSPYYFNMTGFGYHPDVIGPMVEWLEQETETEVLAGVNTGGNSMVSALGGYAIANDSPISFIPVRKSGGDERYEDLDRLGLPDDVNIQDERVDTVDDVGTTGNTVAGLHRLLETAGAEVGSWNIAVDRMEGVRENANKHGADIYALVDAQEALEILYEDGWIGDDEYNAAMSYTEDPMEWNRERGFI